METQIVISTDKTGILLYEAARDGLNFYASHLDDLNNWNNTVLGWEAICKESNLEIDVNFKHIKALISIDSLYSRALIDLMLVTSQLYLTKTKIEQIFYIKQAYLTIYETFENFKTQQPWLESIITNSGEKFKSDFYDWKKSKKIFFKRHKVDSYIRIIRNKLAGHIDLDFKIWHETATSLVAEDAGLAVIDFTNLLKQIQEITNALILKAQKDLEQKNAELQDNTEQLINQLESIKTLLKIENDMPELDSLLQKIKKII